MTISEEREFERRQIYHLEKLGPTEKKVSNSLVGGTTSVE